ncbi:MAG: hypothetical protein JWM62_381 [Frankiales bacterium]|nr:hypothetical protein [Frankiales bacterium]
MGRWSGWSRRAVVMSTLAVLVLGVGAVAPLAGALDPVTEGSDSRVVLSSGRAYVLHVPPLLRRQPRLAEGRPVMVVLHAWLSDPENDARSTGFNRLADRDGVLVAYPEGTRRSFNAGLCCGEAVVQGVDDVAFLSQVVNDLRARGAGRISVVGFSNGGMMAYRFGCERPDLVDTVGVMSGTLEIPLCRGKIKALHIHGEKDTAVPFAGVDYSERLQAFVRGVPTIKAAAPGSDITIRVLKGYNHRWTEPGDEVDATDEFWRFARMRPAS